MSLPIATEGVCTGHACDGCILCKRGRCCQRDLPTYSLPKLGTWPGPVYGELGKLTYDATGERVQCHQCGRFFVKLGWHIFWEHSTTSQEYRSLFGLKQRTGLAGAAYKQEVREANTERLRRVHPRPGFVERLTPEQRSVLKSGVGLPLETLKDPKYKEAMKRVGALTTARARLYECACGCGTMLEPGNGPHRGQRYIRGHIPPTLADRVFHVLEESGGQLMSCRELLEAWPAEEESQVRRALVLLVRQGRVVRPARGLYAPVKGTRP